MCQTKLAPRENAADEARRNSLSGEEALQVAGQEQSDLVGLGGLAVAGADLQHAPAAAGQGVVQVPVRISFFLQQPLLQQHRLVLLVPVRGGQGGFWGGTGKNREVGPSSLLTGPEKISLPTLERKHLQFLLLTLERHANFWGVKNTQILLQVFLFIFFILSLLLEAELLVLEVLSR